MNNGIVERQNEEKYICYLAAQRQLYNEAKRLDGIEILFSVVLPLFFAALQLIISDNTYLNATSYVLSIVSMGISLLFGSYIDRKKRRQRKYSNISIYMCIKCRGIINCLVCKEI